MAFGDTSKSSQGTGTSSYGFGGMRTKTTPTVSGLSSETVPSSQKSLFPRLLEALNWPSQKTEEFLTGGQGYDVALEKGLGIKNVKGQLDPNDVASLTARMVLDPLNIIGMLGLPGKAAKALKLAEVAKLPLKIEPAAKVIRGLEELFVPLAKLKRVAPQLAEELPLQKMATQALAKQAVRTVGKTFEETPVEIKQNLGKLLEGLASGKTLTPAELENVNKAKTLIENLITKPERELGLLPKEVAEYFPRKVEKESLENLFRFSGDRLSTSLKGAQKARTFLTQEAGEAAGVKYKDAVEALAERAAVSKTAQNNAKYIKKLISGEVKDIEGNALVQPITDMAVPGYKEFAIKGLKGMQAPAEAVNEIEKYYKTFTSDEATNSLSKFYDKALLGPWKAAVTGIFPAFHIRNFFGNLHNMWLGGFGLDDLPLLSKAKDLQLGKEVIVNGQKITKELLEQLGIMGKGQFGFDIGKALETGTSKLSYLNPFKAGRTFGTALEDNSKIAFFLQRLNKGDDIYKARSTVAKFLFDYEELTGFEKNAMKRIIPFYTWMRKNIPLQIEQLAKQPHKYAALAKLYKNVGMETTEEEKEALPSYVKEGFFTKLGKGEKGTTKFLTSGSLLPWEDLGRLYRGSAGRTVEREVLGSLSPFLKAPLEMVMNKDIFRGKNLDELGYSYGYSARNFPKSIKELLQYKEEKTAKGKTSYWVNPQRYLLLQESPLSRLLRGLPEPLSYVNPAKIRSFDLEKEAEQRKKEATAGLLRQLLFKGEARKYENIYIPKEKKAGFGSSR